MLFFNRNIKIWTKLGEPVDLSGYIKDGELIIPLIAAKNTVIGAGEQANVEVGFIIQVSRGNILVPYISGEFLQTPLEIRQDPITSRDGPIALGIQVRNTLSPCLADARFDMKTGGVLGHNIWNGSPVTVDEVPHKGPLYSASFEVRAGEQFGTAYLHPIAATPKILQVASHCVRKY